MTIPNSRPRARELGLRLGELPPGPLDAIADVDGVRVGHLTVWGEGEGPDRPVRTGVTVVLPHGGNVFRDKVPAAVHVINGYGKAAGFTQVSELGTLETPIALTGTLSIGAAHEGLVRHALGASPEIGRTAGTVNPVVAECSDARLSDIRALAVRPDHVVEAIGLAATGPVAEGSVGAGTGMICYGWKGGIGTASRVTARGGFTVGALVLANFGRADDLRIAGIPVGRELRPPSGQHRGGSGSCIIVLATNAPADARQLGRLARRAQNGLARTGAYGEHGSGEYVIAFSTARRVQQGSGDTVVDTSAVTEDGPAINQLFQAVTESVEEAVVNALLQAEPTGPHDAAIAPALPLDKLREIIARSPWTG